MGGIQVIYNNKIPYTHYFSTKYHTVVCCGNGVLYIYTVVYSLLCSCTFYTINNVFMMCIPITHHYTTVLKLA